MSKRDSKAARQLFNVGQEVFTWFNSGKVRVVITRHRVIGVAASHRRTARFELPAYHGESCYGYRVEPSFGCGGYIDQAWFRDSQVGAAKAGGA